MGLIDNTTLIQDVESLQEKANCVALSTKKLNYHKEIKDIVINEKDSHLNESFQIIAFFIEYEKDIFKKQDLKQISNKLFLDIKKEGNAVLTRADAPDVFENLFFEYPSLTTVLTKQLKLNRVTYNFYYALDTVVSSGSHYKRYFSTLKSNFNQLSSEEQDEVLNYKDNLLTELKSLQQHECFCTLTATDFLNSSECSEYFI